MSQEITLTKALSNFLTDDALNDFSLEGSDGKRVRANRYVLASRSTVFHRMLVGGFSEATSEVVRVEYPGDVLRAIVEYVHTDSADIRKKATEGEAENGSDPSQGFQQIRNLVSLTAAATYFDLPGLCQKIQENLTLSLNESPVLAYATLEACRQEGPSEPAEVADLALSIIRSGGASVVTPGDVTCLSPALVEEILQDTNTVMDESQLFRFLQVWVEAETFSVENNSDRRTMAKDMVKNIRLEKIDPKMLSTVVETSGLVTHEQLLNAYKAQALVAQERHSISFKRPRYAVPVWESTSTTTTSKYAGIWMNWEDLGVPPITSGVWRWTLRIEKFGESGYIGVKCKDYDGHIRSHFVFTNGDNSTDRQSGILRCSRVPWKTGAVKLGSTLTITLNLLPQA